MQGSGGRSQAESQSPSFASIPVCALSTSLPARVIPFGLAELASAAAVCVPRAGVLARSFSSLLLLRCR